jgi:hypothetical protein
VKYLRCPKCGKEVEEVIVAAKSFHTVKLNGTTRRVRWDDDALLTGLIIFHRVEEDQSCLFTPADGDELFGALTAWLLNEDDDIYPEIAHLFSEKRAERR